MSRLETDNDHRLIVIGEGEVSSPPDQVHLILGVITENEQVTTAQKDNADTISVIVNEIKKMGVGEESIQTSTYRISSEYDYIEGVQIFRGYRVVHLLKIEVDQVNLAGQLIDIAVEKGANSIASIDFLVNDSASLYEDALVQAIEQAHHKAERMVSSFGGKLLPLPIKLVELTESAYSPRNEPMVLSAFDSASTPIQAGESTIKARVEIHFRYE